MKYEILKHEIWLKYNKLMKLFLKLLNKISMKFTGLPSRHYVEYLLTNAEYTWPSRNQEASAPFRMRNRIILHSIYLFAFNFDLEGIQEYFKRNYQEYFKRNYKTKITKERIRQQLIKFVREAEKKL